MINQLLIYNQYHRLNLFYLYYLGFGIYQNVFILYAYIHQLVVSTSSRVHINY